MTPESLLTQIRASPKIDLHRHLLGSARPRTLWNLAHRYRVAIGYESPEALGRALLRKTSARGLPHYIQPWKLLRELVRTPDDVKGLAREAALDASLDEVQYVEFRSSLPSMLIKDGNGPQTHIPTDEYLNAIRDGFAEVTDVACRLVASIPRHAVGAAAPSLIEKYSEAFFRAVSGFRNDLIVGVDLTGVETGWPAELFKDIFREARAMGLPITIHAGETEGPHEIWTAIDQLGASRIGHGTSAPQDARLVKELIRRKIVLEVCPTSGWLTGSVKERGRNPVIECQPPIPYVVCTDNPTLNATTLSHELGLATQMSGAPVESLLESQFQLASQAAFSRTPLMTLVK